MLLVSPRDVSTPLPPRPVWGSKISWRVSFRFLLLFDYPGCITFSFLFPGIFVSPRPWYGDERRRNGRKRSAGGARSTARRTSTTSTTGTSTSTRRSSARTTSTPWKSGRTSRGGRPSDDDDHGLGAIYYAMHQEIWRRVSSFSFFFPTCKQDVFVESIYVEEYTWYMI